jgi:hypothetical protein
VLGLVMAYDDGLHQWQPCGNQQQFANIYILYNEAAKIYRFYGIDSSDGEVSLWYHVCGANSVCILTQFWICCSVELLSKTEKSAISRLENGKNLLETCTSIAMSLIGWTAYRKSCPAGW